MEFDWDPAKSQSNLRKHGVPFKFAAEAWNDAHRVDREDRRRDYGEQRWLTLAKIYGRVYAVTFTKRGEICRIISARKANRREQAEYNLRSLHIGPEQSRQTHS